MLRLSFTQQFKQFSFLIVHLLVELCRLKAEMTHMMLEEAPLHTLNLTVIRKADELSSLFSHYTVQVHNVFRLRFVKCDFSLKFC